MTLQLHAAAAATKRLFQKGIYGPKIEEIAEEAHGGLWPVGREEISWVKKHSVQIKDILVVEHSFSVCLVNRRYYEDYHRKAPSTMELAKGVLPQPGSYSTAGLHFMVSEVDTIWQALQDKLRNGGLGTLGKHAKNISLAVKRNMLSSVNGESLVKELKDETEKIWEAKKEK